jgi:hypothetical protein
MICDAKVLHAPAVEGFHPGIANMERVQRPEMFVHAIRERRIDGTRHRERGRGVVGKAGHEEPFGLRL